MKYLVWSNYHRAWWGPSQRGYTNRLRRAGVYTKEEAERICQLRSQLVSGRPAEVAVPECDALTFAGTPEDHEFMRAVDKGVNSTVVALLGGAVAEVARKAAIGRIVGAIIDEAGGHAGVPAPVGPAPPEMPAEATNIVDGDLHR